MNSKASWTRRSIAALFVGCAAAFAVPAGSGRAASPDQAPPVDPGQARVWFLRQPNPGNWMHAPTITVNGAAFAIAVDGTVFYRDFAPGSYVFDIANCIPQPQTSQTLILSAGNDFALQVVSDPDTPMDCQPNQVSFLTVPSPDALVGLFAPLEYLGAQ